MACRVLVVCLAALVLAAGASGSTSATTARTFQDSVREDPAGPDITTVAASSDGSVLTFRVSIPTNPTVTPDFRLRIWLDADDSLETGLTLDSGPTGLDHFLLVDPTRFRPDEAALYSCEGTVCRGGSGVSSVEFRYAGGATFTTDARSLGLKHIARLRFSVSVTTGIVFGPSGYDFTNAHFDAAPDADEEGVQPMWTFSAQPIRIASFRAEPAHPRAGSPLTLSLRAVDDLTGEPLIRGKVRCLLKVHGKRIAAGAGGLAGRRATCTFRVPAGTTGSRYRATIEVAALGATVKRSVSGRVR